MLFNYPISKVSLLILNEIEGAQLSGKTEFEEIHTELNKRFPHTDILLTLGKDGAVFFDGCDKIYHGIYRTNVLDTTAAGDTLLGYFTAQLTLGVDAKKALEMVSKASSITISRHGAAQSIPTLNEVENSDFYYLGFQSE